MASVLRTLSIHRKRDSNQKTLTVGHLVSASLETIGVGPPSKDTGSSAKRSVVPGPSKLTGKSADSTGAFSYIDSSSTVQSSGSSLGTTGSSSTQFSSTSSSNQQSTNEKAVFDFNAEIFVNLRKEPVSKLTGRVKDISIRPIFEGVYSNVWTGALDGGQKVSRKLLARFFLARIRRSQLSVFETRRLERRRRKGWVHIFSYLLYLPWV